MYDISTDSFIGQETERIGFQLWCWAFTTCLENGWLDEKGNRTIVPIPVARQTIREPGGKVRVVTLSPAALIVYLQPFAHVAKEFL